MLGAFAAQVGFSVFFLTRLAMYGLTPFRGTGALEVAYLVVVVSHEAVAVVTVPLVLVTLALGLRRKDRLHRDVAPLAYGAWLFVSVTGLPILGLLYLL